MQTCYITYYSHGQMKRAVVNSTQYTKLSADPAVENLILHLNQRQMEEAYANSKGNSINTKSILLG